jgi:hypothetical protein
MGWHDPTHPGTGQQKRGRAGTRATSPVDEGIGNAVGASRVLRVVCPPVVNRTVGSCVQWDVQTARGRGVLQHPQKGALAIVKRGPAGRARNSPGSEVRAHELVLVA